MEDFRDDELKKWLAEEYEKEIDEMEEVLRIVTIGRAARNGANLKKRKKRQKLPTKNLWTD